MQANAWRFAGRIVDGDGIESAGAFADTAFGEEVLGGAGQEMLFARRDA